MKLCIEERWMVDCVHWLWVNGNNRKKRRSKCMRLNKLTPIITHTTMKNHDEKLKSFHQLIHRLSFSLFAPFCYRKNAQIPQINVHNMLIPSPYLLFFFTFRSFDCSTALRFMHNAKTKRKNKREKKAE